MTDRLTGASALAAAKFAHPFADVFTHILCTNTTKHARFESNLAI